MRLWMRISGSTNQLQQFPNGIPLAVFGLVISFVFDDHLCVCSIHPLTNHYHTIVTLKTPSTLGIPQFLSSFKMRWMSQIGRCSFPHHSFLRSNLDRRRDFHARPYTTKQTMRLLEVNRECCGLQHATLLCHAVP